jgi:ubiquinone/menaquinone biosynthesis C-methylase UbiE
VSETEFDRYAADYRATVNEAADIAGVDVDRLAGDKAQLLLDLLERRLGDASSRKVLDVGCGIGLVDAELVSGVGELHGIDTSRKSVDEATRAVPTARFRHFGGKRIPHADAAFDMVFAICVLHHVPPRDRPAFLAEMARVTRPGGIVAIVEHNPLNPVTRHIVSRCAFDRDAALLRRGAGARLLAGAGLEPGGRGYIAFWPRRSALIERIEKRIGWLPAGAQYYVWATKGAAGPAIASRPAPRRRG